MGCCCSKPKVKDPNTAHCAGNEYPRNPAYANMPQSLPLACAPGSQSGFIGGPGGSGSFVEGAAAGYMLSQHGGMGMLSGIDGGPRVAIGGNYHGMM